MKRTAFHHACVLLGTLSVLLTAGAWLASSLDAEEHSHACRHLDWGVSGCEPVCEHHDCCHEAVFGPKTNEIWQTGSVRAMLCNDCGFGNRKENCVKCGKWMGSTKIPAYLCSSCGFGNRKDECVKCGRWIGSGGVPACICGSCGFGNRKDDCVKCGKWRGGN